jgi:hypothetical protein
MVPLSPKEASLLMLWAFKEKKESIAKTTEVV